MKKRRHHFLPCSYLSNFASADERNGLLWVFDKQVKKKYHQTCANVAFKKDYYKVLLKNTDEEFIEKQFSLIEGEGKRIINAICNSHLMPTDAEYLELMAFLGILATRVPAIRENLIMHWENVYKLISRSIMHHKTPEEIYETMKRGGSPLSSLDEAKRIKEFGKKGEYEITFDNTSEVKLMIELSEFIGPILSKRNWAVLYSTENQKNYFVTNDNPVMLSWIKQVGNMNPGFGLPDTEVFIPLSKKCIINGIFEPRKYANLRITNRLIKKYNYLTCLYSDRFIYSADEHFLVTNRHGETEEFNFQKNFYST